MAGIANEMRKHLINGVLAPDYQLPETLPAGKHLTPEQRQRAMRAIVRAVNCPECFRLGFSRALRRLKRFGRSVPYTEGADALRACFQEKGGRLNPVFMGQFTSGAIASADAESVRYGLWLTPLLVRPVPFAAQPVPVYLWNRMISDALVLRCHPDFALPAEFALEELCRTDAAEQVFQRPQQF